MEASKSAASHHRRATLCLKYVAPVALAVSASYYVTLQHELGWDIRRRGGVPLLCIEAMDFVMESSVAPYWHRTYWGASRIFAEVCEGLYSQLPPEQKAALAPLLGAPLPNEVLRRYEWWSGEYWQTHIRNFSAYAEQQAIKAKAPRSQLPRGPGAEGYRSMMQGQYNLGEPWTAELGLMGEPQWMQAFANPHYIIDDAPSQEPLVEPSEVLAAMKVGQPVRFDARKILPASTFNVSLIDIMRLHGEEANKIPILGYDRATECRLNTAWKMKRYLLAGESTVCSEPFTLAMVDKRFIDVDEGIVRGLGLQDEVERASGQLNLGVTRGEPHWDEQDNIFVGVFGINVVLVVPQNYTDAADGYKGSGYGTPPWDWLLAHEFRKEVMPFYWVVLRPGEGVLIPSRSYHTILGTYDRVAFNTFLEPKFGRMQWESNPQSHWHRESVQRKAVRNLWVQTIKRMWDTKKLSIHIQGYNLEML